MPSSEERVPGGEFQRSVEGSLEYSAEYLARHACEETNQGQEKSTWKN